MFYIVTNNYRHFNYSMPHLIEKIKVSEKSSAHSFIHINEKRFSFDLCYHKMCKWIGVSFEKCGNLLYRCVIACRILSEFTYFCNHCIQTFYKKKYGALEVYFHPTQKNQFHWHENGMLSKRLLSLRGNLFSCWLQYLIWVYSSRVKWFKWKSLVFNCIHRIKIKNCIMDSSFISFAQFQWIFTCINLRVCHINL